MGKLIPILIKVFSFVVIINLLSYFCFSIIFGLGFLLTISKICTVNFILVMAVILKLLFNITSFLNHKIVQESGWIKSFIIIAGLDILILILPFALSFSSLFLKFNKENKFIEQVTPNIKAIYDSNYDSLNPFQINFLKSLFLYIVIALCMTIYFRYKYKKEIKK